MLCVAKPMRGHAMMTISTALTDFQHERLVVAIGKLAGHARRTARTAG